MKIRWYHWMVYRLFRWVWNPIYKQNPQMTQFMINRMSQWIDSKNAGKVVDENEKSDAGFTVESKRNMQNEHYNIVINAPRTEAVMTDKFRDGNDLPCLCRTLESELNEALFQIEQLKSIITEMVKAGDEMAQYISTLEEGNLLKKWLNSKKDLNEY